MSEIGHYLRRRWLRRRHRLVRIGWLAASYARRSDNVRGVGMGLAVMAIGLAKGRSSRRLIYKTSIDAGQGTTIVVKRGRRPLGRTAPIR